MLPPLKQSMQKMNFNDCLTIYYSSPWKKPRNQLKGNYLICYFTFFVSNKRSLLTIYLWRDVTELNSCCCYCLPACQWSFNRVILMKFLTRQDWLDIAISDKNLKWMQWVRVRDAANSTQPATLIYILISSTYFIHIAPLFTSPSFPLLLIPSSPDRFLRFVVPMMSMCW